MSNVISGALIDFLACPDCSGELSRLANALTCASCRRKYEVRNGIPLLYPEDMDLAHLREEESLAKMMKRPPLGRKHEFSSMQWRRSKNEFWGMVKAHIGPPPKSIVNVGCGYDGHFREFQQTGHVFVNFDIVYDMLYSLRKDFGASHCVAGDLNRLPFKKESFDYVVSIDVVHHESDRVSILLESFRDLLKQGGSLFLEDLNAWGVFQFPKSVLLPKPLHRILRSAYHNIRRSSRKPADYEFATSVWSVKKTLRGLGFPRIIVHENRAYPNIGPRRFRVYQFLSSISWFRKYQNYHYVLRATRGPA